MSGRVVSGRCPSRQCHEYYLEANSNPRFCSSYLNGLVEALLWSAQLLLGFVTWKKSFGGAVYLCFSILIDSKELQPSGNSIGIKGHLALIFHWRKCLVHLLASFLHKLCGCELIWFEAKNRLDVWSVSDTHKTQIMLWGVCHRWNYKTLNQLGQWGILGNKMLWLNLLSGTNVRFPQNVSFFHEWNLSRKRAIELFTVFHGIGKLNFKELRFNSPYQTSSKFEQNLISWDTT